MDFFDPPYGGSNKGFPVQGLGTPAGVFHPGWGGTPPTQRMYVVDFGVLHLLFPTGKGKGGPQRIHVAFVFPCAYGTGKNGLLLPPRKGLCSPTKLDCIGGPQRMHVVDFGVKQRGVLHVPTGRGQMAFGDGCSPFTSTRSEWGTSRPVGKGKNGLPNFLN